MLVASSVYFERTHVTRDISNGTAKVTGKLRCRFEESSEFAKEMGLFFKKHQRADFQPYFDIQDGFQHHSRDKILLDSTLIERMASHGVLDVHEIELTVATSGREAEIRLYLHNSSGRTKGYPISGFPRDFFKEIERVEADTEETEAASNGDVSKTASVRTIPSINLPGGKPTSLLRLGVSGSASEQNLSTQAHGLLEDRRRKSDDVVARSHLGKVAKTLSLRAKISEISLRDDKKRVPRPERPERPQSSREISPDDGPFIAHTHVEALQEQPQHHRSFSRRSAPEQLPRERDLHETPFSIQDYDTSYASPRARSQTSTSSTMSTTSKAGLNPKPLTRSNPYWEASSSPSPPPPLPKIPTDSPATSNHSAIYGNDCVYNLYSSPYSEAAPERVQHTTPFFNGTFGSLDLLNHALPHANDLQNQYPISEAERKANLELEFAVQLSLVEQEEEEREENRRLQRAMEESRKYF